MLNSEVKPGTGFRPVDLNLTILIKYISDWAAILKKISPFSSLVFILFNIKHILFNKKAIITCLLFIPALIITPSFDILRFIFTVAIFWIFIEKMKMPGRNFSSVVAVIISLYSIIIFAGIFDTDYYVRMDNSFRYTFILETHNALTILVFASFVYLINYFLEKDVNRAKWLNVLVFIAMLLLCIVLLFIKSRLYIALSFALTVLIALKVFKASRIFMLVPIWYALCFVAISQFSMLVIKSDANTNLNRPGAPPPKPAIVVAVKPDTVNVDKAITKKPDSISKTKMEISPVKKDSIIVDRDSIRREEALRLVDNKRIFSLSGTGREKLLEIFTELFKELGWKKFLYQNNTAIYFDKKSRIHNINVNASTLTESSYLIILLNTGFLGLFVFAFIFLYYINFLVRRRSFFALTYFLLLMAVWFFEETIAFPFSMVFHLLALTTIHSLEKRSYETGIDQ